jgi:hypothetical protein
MPQEEHTMNRLVNLTTHIVTIRTPDGDFEFAPDPRGPARIVEEAITVPPALYRVDDFAKVGDTWSVRAYPVGIPVSVSGLPAPEPGVAFIVSRMVLDSPLVSGRGDLVAPGTGPKDEPVRDERDQVIAVTRLLRAVRGGTVSEEVSTQARIAIEAAHSSGRYHDGPEVVTPEAAQAWDWLGLQVDPHWAWYTGYYDARSQVEVIAALGRPFSTLEAAEYVAGTEARVERSF